MKRIASFILKASSGTEFDVTENAVEKNLNEILNSMIDANLMTQFRDCFEHIVSTKTNILTYDFTASEWRLWKTLYLPSSLKVDANESGFEI